MLIESGVYNDTSSNCTPKMVESTITNARYTYIHDYTSSVDTHHVVVRRNASMNFLIFVSRLLLVAIPFLLFLFEMQEILAKFMENAVSFDQQSNALRVKYWSSINGNNSVELHTVLTAMDVVGVMDFGLAKVVDLIIKYVITQAVNPESHISFSEEMIQDSGRKTEVVLKMVPSFEPKRNGPPVNSTNSSKLLSGPAKGENCKKGTSTRNANVGYRASNMPAPTFLKPCTSVSNKNSTTFTSCDGTFSRKKAPYAQFNMDTSSIKSDCLSVALDGSMSSSESLKSPEVEYIDNTDVEAIDSIERKTYNKLCISDDGKTAGSICKRDILAEMETGDRIVDVDENSMDPQLCATLACDIYKHLRASEVKKRPSTDFMETVQKDINASMRAILVDWLVEDLMFISASDNKDERLSDFAENVEVHFASRKKVEILAKARSLLLQSNFVLPNNAVPSQLYKCSYAFFSSSHHLALVASDQVSWPLVQISLSKDTRKKVFLP
ncbi:hypothetical protein POM88_049011 [Heracleum sosnowskyi]|uniref:Uncharacterized protein n=1 Tax=Heracleum sosnowskyi TaxID=360622 RepID=A0AAD8LZ43_9APIA|nr:hypothetical protein POM88_049011 [Heracleum sosnowskyi]